MTRFNIILQLLFFPITTRFDRIKALEENCFTQEDYQMNVDDIGNGMLQVLGSTKAPNGDIMVELLGPKLIDNSASVIITIGHGGKFKPSYIPDRSKSHRLCSEISDCSLLSDLHTAAIGFQLASQIIEKFGKVPYVVFNHLHRCKLDVNRNKLIGAQGDPLAEKAWYAYHDFIYQAQLKLKHRFGTVRGTSTFNSDVEGVKGLLVDLHGYAGKNWQNGNGSIGPPPFIHWGYGLMSQDLREKTLDETKSTFELACSLNNHDLESLIRGESSLGSRFYSLFNKLHDGNSKYVGAGIPSAEFPYPHSITEDPHWCDNAGSHSKGCEYFGGGYTVKQHEYLDWLSGVGELRMNTVQVEIPKKIRFGDVSASIGRERMHLDFAHALSISLMAFMDDLFGTGGATTKGQSLIDDTSLLTGTTNIGTDKDGDHSLRLES